MLAILSNLHFTELLLIALVGIMVFGNRLPRLAVQIATQLTKARRSLNKVWRETGVQEEIRRMQRELRDAEYQVRDAARQAADAEERSEAEDAGLSDDQTEEFEGAEHDAPYHEGETDHVEGEEGSSDSGETTDEPEGEAARRAAAPHPGPDPYPGETG